MGKSFLTQFMFVLKISINSTKSTLCQFYTAIKYIFLNSVLNVIAFEKSKNY